MSRSFVSFLSRIHQYRYQYSVSVPQISPAPGFELPENPAASRSGPQAELLASAVVQRRCRCARHRSEGLPEPSAGHAPSLLRSTDPEDARSRPGLAFLTTLNTLNLCDSAVAPPSPTATVPGMSGLVRNGQPKFPSKGGPPRRRPVRLIRFADLRYGTPHHETLMLPNTVSPTSRCPRHYRVTDIIVSPTRPCHRHRCPRRLRPREVRCPPAEPCMNRPASPSPNLLCSPSPQIHAFRRGNALRN